MNSKSESAHNSGCFSGKKALVIGGSGGIGKEVALGLAQCNAELTIHGGSSAERLEKTIKAIREIGGKATGFLLQIESPKDAEKILAHLPDPDILVCAWGPFRRGSLETLDRDFWQKTVESNLIFPGFLVSLVLKGMMERNFGRILLFGGTNTDTIRGFTTTAAYSAAKTGLAVLAKSAAKTAGHRGVTCNVICPGLTDTEYLEEDQKRYNREKSPLGPMQAAEVARVALDTMEKPCINGAVIPVDRGIVL